MKLVWSLLFNRQWAEAYLADPGSQPRSFDFHIWPLLGEGSRRQKRGSSPFDKGIHGYCHWHLLITDGPRTQQNWDPKGVKHWTRKLFNLLKSCHPVTWYMHPQEEFDQHLLDRSAWLTTFFPSWSLVGSEYCLMAIVPIGPGYPPLSLGCERQHFQWDTCRLSWRIWELFPS